MKKILIAVLFLTLVLFAGPSFAKEELVSTTPTPTPVPIIKYDLPYPGMLPDSPFYKLKVLRDKIMLILIQDPMKKVEFHLLLADKRISMSKLLVGKGKIELAKETALKGENEYTLITFLLKDKELKPSKQLFERLQNAALKHQEVLNEIIMKVSEKDKKAFETVIYFSKQNAEEIKKINNTF